MATTSTSTDDKGRMPGPDAVKGLLDSVPEGPAWNKGLPENNWIAADNAVDAADDETVRAALRRLLALQMFRLQSAHPEVAARNVHDGDLIMLGGIPCRVVGFPVQKNADAAVHIKARPDHLPYGEIRTYIHDADVMLDLIDRSGPQIFKDGFAVSAAPSGRSDIKVQLPENSSAKASLTIADVQIEFDATRAGRNASLEALDELQLTASELERSLRVIWEV
jgi:hypothetical protein